MYPVSYNVRCVCVVIALPLELCSWSRFCDIGQQLSFTLAWAQKRVDVECIGGNREGNSADERNSFEVPFARFKWLIMNNDRCSSRFSSIEHMCSSG